MIIEDRVIRGRGLGKKLGYPTANLAQNHGIPSGVYRASIFFKNKRYDGFLIVGAFQSKGLSAEEVYLLGFQGNLYGKKLKIEVKERLRTIKKFQRSGDLKKQIKEDIQCLQELLRGEGKLFKKKPRGAVPS